MHCFFFFFLDNPIVTFSAGQVSAGVIFPDVDILSQAISEVEHQKSIVGM